MLKENKEAVEIKDLIQTFLENWSYRWDNSLTAMQLVHHLEQNGFQISRKGPSESGDNADG